MKVELQELGPHETIRLADILATAFVDSTGKLRKMGERDGVSNAESFYGLTVAEARVIRRRNVAALTGRRLEDFEISFFRPVIID